MAIYMLYFAHLVNCCIMSYLLASPDSSAPLHDWRIWLEELRDMTPSAEVKAAIRKAEKILRSQRDQEKRNRVSYKHRYHDED